jgi:hypothetical protein
LAKPWRRDREDSQRLETVRSINPVTATVLVASMHHEKNFENGRQGTAW